MFLDAARIPDSYRVGAVNDGWRVGNSTLSGERQMVSGSGSGGVDRIGGSAIASLVRLGVDYLVVHTDGYAPGEWEDVERRLAAYRDVLSLEIVDGAGRIYSVRAAGAPRAQ